MAFFAEITDSVTGYHVVIEDNGRVGYAYLLDSQKQIVADVWLYNACETPQEPEWADHDKMPFANPSAFVHANSSVAPLRNKSDVQVEWSKADSGNIKATIFIRDERYAILIHGSRPGWSVMAAKNGPLALTFERPGL